MEYSEVPMVPITREIILKEKRDFLMPRDDREVVVSQEEME